MLLSVILIHDHAQHTSAANWYFLDHTRYEIVLIETFDKGQETKSSGNIYVYIYKKKKAFQTECIYQLEYGAFEKLRYDVEKFM